MIRVLVGAVMTPLIASTTGASPTLIVGILGALGGIGALANIYLAPRQGKSIAVTASEAAVRAVNEAMASLQRQLDDARRELTRTQDKLMEVQANAEVERKALTMRVELLQDRVKELESRLNDERSGIDKSAYSGSERRAYRPDFYRGPERRGKPEGDS